MVELQSTLLLPGVCLEADPLNWWLSCQEFSKDSPTCRHGIDGNIVTSQLRVFSPKVGLSPEIPGDFSLAVPKCQ